MTDSTLHFIAGIIAFPIVVLLFSAIRDAYFHFMPDKVKELSKSSKNSIHRK